VNLMMAIVIVIAGSAGAQPHPSISGSMSMSTIAAASPGGSGFASGAAGVIGNGDLLEMSVFDTPELSGKLRVSNTGEVALPLVGKFLVAGMKAEDAAGLIGRKFADAGYLRDPQVTVFISEYATQNVSVLGEVRNPGIYPAFGSHRLLDYLSAAQGLTPLAGTTITITHAGEFAEIRRDEAQPTKVKMTAGATPTPENNPEILSGDTVFVERAGIVYVVGDVARPGGFLFDHDGHLTVLQAIALAQGVNYTAAKGTVSLLRTIPSGRQEIPINLKKIFASKAADLALQDNDILFVPSSMARGALKAVATTAVPAAATATIYHVP